jgi:ABC-type glycerol-3-phosphate transport system substrate-binding protein
MRKHLLMAALFVALFTCLSMVVPIQAQDSGVTISLSVPEFMKDSLEAPIKQFQDQNPGITVQVKGSSVFFGGNATAGIDDYLKNAADYASTADVVYMSASQPFVEATRAGFVQDLTPLVSSDSSLNTADFIPAAWQSFQWDGGTWALPTSVDVTFLTYDPAAFDKANLAYPNEKWTMDDLANAARTLAVKDESRAVTQPGLAVPGEFGTLIRSLLGKGLYDDSIPSAPTFTDPNLETLLTTWADLEKEGVVTTDRGQNYDSIPMHIDGTFSLIGRRNQTDTRKGTLLPGGKAGINVQGFAISSGTQYLEQAYALAKFLTNSPEVSNNFQGIRPARQSLNGVQPQNQGGPGGGPGGFRRRLTPEVEALVDQALANAIPVSEMRFTDYLNVALDKIVTGGEDAHTALQDAETQASTNLQTAAAEHDTTTIAVATPVPPLVLQTGKVEIKFGIQSFVFPLPNQDKWNQLAQDFAASDPQVGAVTLDTVGPGGGGGSNDLAKYDCYYTANNRVPGINLDSVLSLDPYMSADPTFDKTDFIGNTLAQVQRDNKTWAYPIILQPDALHYSVDEFAKAGITAPQNGWTISEFNDALKALKPNTSDPAPFETREPGGTYLLLLIAAYGGLPLDYRTNPPTPNFKDPKNIEAIRQVLDLAKQGYFNYQELGGNRFVITIGNDTVQPAVYSARINGLGFGRRGPQAGDTQDTGYQLTTYPTGTSFSAASYDIGTAYINSSSQNPEACYRWISYLGQHPDMFSGMPARMSQINDSNIAAAQGADATAFYKQMATAISDPNTVIFPSVFGGGNNSPSNFLLQFWLNRAFDNYVLKDGNLENDLNDAQTYAKDFLECTAAIPPYDAASGQNQQEYNRQYTDCATKADPTLSSLFAQ